MQDNYPVNISLLNNKAISSRRYQWTKKLLMSTKMTCIPHHKPCKCPWFLIHTHSVEQDYFI